MGAEEAMEGIVLVAQRTGSRDPTWEGHSQDHGQVLRRVSQEPQPVTDTRDQVSTIGPTGVTMA